jgi:hypothetical protein
MRQQAVVQMHAQHHALVRALLRVKATHKIAVTIDIQIYEALPPFHSLRSFLDLLFDLIANLRHKLHVVEVGEWFQQAFEHV